MTEGQRRPVGRRLGEEELLQRRGFGADVAYAFTGPHLGLWEGQSFTPWATAPEPLTWDPAANTLTDANGDTVKMNVVFSRPQ